MTDPITDLVEAAKAWYAIREQQRGMPVDDTYRRVLERFQGRCQVEIILDMHERIEALESIVNEYSNSLARQHMYIRELEAENAALKSDLETVLTELECIDGKESCEMITALRMRHALTEG